MAVLVVTSTDIAIYVGLVACLLLFGFVCFLLWRLYRHVWRWLNVSRKKTDEQVVVNAAVGIGIGLVQGWAWWLIPLIPVIRMLGKRHQERRERERAQLKAEVERYEKEFPPRVYR